MLKVFPIIFALALLSRDISAVGVPDKEFISTKYLQDLADNHQFTFDKFQENPQATPLEGLSSKVARFSVDGLNQYALILQPKKSMPKSGWPVIIFNHGFHPEPFQSGRRNNDGINDRPGDYYRQIPQAFARGGFIVITPDYRGHNDSEGGEFTLLYESPRWYARDIIATTSAIKSLEKADVKNVFVVAHSMGAEVSLFASAVLTKKIKGMSIWSASMPPITKANNRIFPFKKDINGKYPKPSSVIYADLVHSPINLHHATGDPVTKFQDSRDLAHQLNSLGKECYLYSYDSNNHLFKGENFFTAVERDLEFFQSILKSENVTK